MAGPWHAPCRSRRRPAILAPDGGRGRVLTTGREGAGVAKRSKGGRRHRWVDWPSERILELRFRELGLELEGTWLEECVERLYGELERKGLLLRPHVWLSEEWFSPEGVSGIAIPFFLAHPRLMRLERQMMLEVEGGTREQCMKLLRHETGHAVQHAYRVHRRRQWQKLFGRSSAPYPDAYRAKPASRKHVQHLDSWYAQSHPDEDFAETFAVWLKPRSAWRERYRGWPVLKKLEYVDQAMAELRGVRPGGNRRATPFSVTRMGKTLRRYYQDKRERYAPDEEGAYDRDLLRVFRTGGAADGVTAASFLRRHRREFRELVCRWTGESAFTVDQILKEMIIRCQERKLRAVGRERALKLDFTGLLTVHTVRCLYRGSGWHAL